MKISLNLNNYINKTKFACSKTYKNNFCGNIETSQDTFVRSPNNIENPFNSNKRKFEITDYTKLSQTEINSIKQTHCTKSEIKRVQRNVELAYYFKKYLDEKYGKDNYIFECIGTSPSTIGRVLEFMGVETHYFPISNLIMPAEENFLNTIKKNKEMKKVYSEFLKTQGIDKNKIKNSNKTYLFYDYIRTGRSIDRFKTILKQYLRIPTNNQNIEFKSFNDDLLKLFEGTENNGTCLEFVLDELFYSNAEIYGGIDHLDFHELEKINDILQQKTSSDSKLYNFLVMDELNKRGLLKENPANKVSL